MGNQIEQENFEDDDEVELFEHHSFVVDKGQNLLRIDKFLTDKVANATRNKVQNSIEAGNVLVNGKQVKPNYKIKPLDEIKVYLEKPVLHTEVLAEPIPLDIIFEDNYLLIVNKPPGMVVHPAHGNWTGTLVNVGILFQSASNTSG